MILKELERFGELLKSKMERTAFKKLRIKKCRNLKINPPFSKKWIILFNMKTRNKSNWGRIMKDGRFYFGAYLKVFIDNSNYRKFKVSDYSKCCDSDWVRDLHKFCGKCGLTLDLKEALEMEKKLREKDELLNMLISDPDVKQLIVEKAKVMKHG